MKFTHIFVLFVTLFAAAACSFTELDDVTSAPEHGSQYLQVVGRVAQYSDCDVTTRSKKEDEESRITSMGLALFPIENGAIGNCLYYDFQIGNSIVFIIDRHDDVFNEYIDKEFAMYIFANMQEVDGFPKTSEEGVGKSLVYFANCAVAANDRVAEVPVNGFPMMGSLGNTVSTDNGITADGVKLILKPTQSDSNVDGLPLVGDSPTDNLEIPLKSMYAKFSFTISVKPNQEIVGNKAPRFDLLSYSVNNIAATIDLDSSTNYDNNVILTSGEVGMNIYAQGATTAKFDFYLPERYLNPSKNSINDVLPDDLKAGTPDEIEKYRQRFKNLLVDGKAATYVTVKGKYTDHQGNIYDVNYNIYLGGNNYDDFNIIRNTHYDNSLTIRGITATDDQAVNESSISIDWRVNVKRSTPLVIGLLRESLLDAHYEVRPLRLRLVGEDIPVGTSATVQILNEDGTTNNIPGWIRLEKSGAGSDVYIDSGISKGKRKYFTTNLVTETLAGGTSVTVTDLDRSNQTVWVYIDENATTTSRVALVRVTYNNSDTKDFKFVQHGLHKVVGADSGREYYIEEYEEYLYNYDAEESYGQIKEEGMPWGLNGVQLSNKYTSFDTDKAGTGWKSDYTSKYPLPYYDFYIAKHDDDNEESDVYTKDGGTLHNYAGQAFTEEIAENPDSGVEYITLGEQADSAVEYCYNRNKKNSDGTVDVKWYLPSADELEDFIVPAYSTFKEFQDNYYWTSQPAYIRNIFYYEYLRLIGSGDTYAFIIYEDNIEYARATKVVYTGGNYDTAPSGLDTTPTPIVDNRAKRGESNSTNLGYFYMMRYWKRSSLGSKDYGQDKKGIANAIANGIDVTNGSYDEFFNDTKDGKRYYVHLGHLYNMIQKTEEGEHGYHPRTKNNRVRCVRKMD